ncbi:hypothetical protein [Azospirillum sp. sgz302134]
MPPIHVEDPDEEPVWTPADIFVPAPDTLELEEVEGKADLPPLSPGQRALFDQLLAGWTLSSNPHGHFWRLHPPPGTNWQAKEVHFMRARGLVRRRMVVATTEADRTTYTPARPKACARQPG